MARSQPETDSVHAPDIAPEPIPDNEAELHPACSDTARAGSATLSAPMPTASALSSASNPARPPAPLRGGRAPAQSVASVGPGPSTAEARISPGALVGAPPWPAAYLRRRAGARRPCGRLGPGEPAGGRTARRWQASARSRGQDRPSGRTLASRSSTKSRACSSSSSIRPACRSRISNFSPASACRS